MVRTLKMETKGWIDNESQSKKVFAASSTYFLATKLYKRIQLIWSDWNIHYHFSV